MDFSAISKYRSEIMGIAILEVMLLHAFTLGMYTVPGIIQTMINLVFVQGFLFLSGYGLFFSVVKDSSISRFYKRRLKSIFIPYLLIVLPYYTYFLIVDKQYLIPVYSEGYFGFHSPIISYLGQITTIGYWFEGNFNGMWYLALSVLLYILFPLTYRMVFNSKGELGGGKSYIIWIAILLVAKYTPNICNHINPDYYRMLIHSLPTISMFFVGMMFGHWGYFKRPVDYKLIFLICLLYWCSSHFMTIAAIIMLPIILEKINSHLLLKSLKWFGRHSLELYVIHLTLFSVINLMISKTETHSYYIALLITYILSFILAHYYRFISEKIKLLLS